MLTSRSRSERATTGFYVVYLFDAAGGDVYLSLNQGTTDFRDGDFVRKPLEVIARRVGWAQASLGDWLDELDGGSADMTLHDPSLGVGYELGNIASLGYGIDDLPGDDVLLADAERFAKGLAILYREHD